jgi:hypothetical protein
MRYLDLVDRKTLGISFVVFLAVYAAALIVAGSDPSDNEMRLAFVVAISAGYAVSFVIMRRGWSKDK